MNAAERNEARRQEVIDQARNLPTADLVPWVGRLWHSARRFSWVIRFDAMARTFEDGSRWEPTDKVVI